MLTALKKLAGRNQPDRLSQPDRFSHPHDLRDLSEEQQEIMRKVLPFTMTFPERMAALIHAVNHVSANAISGDIVECGVWRGGSMMIAALSLLELGDTSRSLYLYDTFEGMPPPSIEDRRIDGCSADDVFEDVRAVATVDDVQQNIASTGYPSEKVRIVPGRVEDTIPATAPDSIALLRLDTDWYASTKHELHHLYPRLVSGGILIIDDYGHWEGARKATDEYFAGQGVYLHRIDYTGRLLVKR